MDQSHSLRLELEHDRHLHRSFLVAIELGRESPSAETVKQMLGELVEGLSEHMAVEEENLFPWLIQVLPHRADTVHALERQHGDLTRLLGRLEQAKLQQGQPVPRPIIEVAKQFVRMLDQHSNVERDLVLEATDLQREKASS